MKVNGKILSNVEKETNKLFLETFERWQKANGDDLFVDDRTYKTICEYIPKEEAGLVSNKNIFNRTLYKLKCVQDMREKEDDKKYKMFKNRSEYIYNCFRTYFLSEIIFRKRFNVKKILGLFKKIKLDTDINISDLNDFINRLLEV